MLISSHSFIHKDLSGVDWTMSWARIKYNGILAGIANGMEPRLPALRRPLHGGLSPFRHPRQRRRPNVERRPSTAEPRRNAGRYENLSTAASSRCPSSTESIDFRRKSEKNILVRARNRADFRFVVSHENSNSFVSGIVRQQNKTRCIFPKKKFFCMEIFKLTWIMNRFRNIFYSSLVLPDKNPFFEVFPLHRDVNTFRNSDCCIAHWFANT